MHVHRVAWEIFRGPIPEGKWVLHAPHEICGSTQCVNPEHLKLGTAKENTADSIRDGTQKGGQCKPVKYSDALVVKIRAERAEGLGYKQLGAKYGIHPEYVRDLVRGKWRRSAGGLGA